MTLLIAVSYGALLVFALASSAKTRRFFLRLPHPHFGKHQETIVANMPLAVLVIDRTLTILSHNTKAKKLLSPVLGKKLSFHLNRPETYLHHLVQRLAKHGTKEELAWQIETGKKRTIVISASFLPANNTRDDTFMIFAEEIKQ